MKTKHIALTTNAAGLGASPLALAHGNEGAGTNLYHYLSSPDHLMTFGALAMIALAIVVRALRRSTVAARRDKR